ncbi:MAG: biosynthetic-type acetolactate synthase large subunit [Gammaproteobacteria bacterium]
MQLTGSQLLLNTLIEQGVELIFGYPGGAIMPTYDALFDKQSQLHHVLMRHEQGAVHAAVGYARASGNVGVCLATSGPGATNLITGIADAMMDSVPLVCITGQVAQQFLGTDAFQESDIVSMTIPVTKWNYQVTCAEEIPYIMAKAFSVATQGRPGPVLVDITKDVQLALTNATTLSSPQKCSVSNKNITLSNHALKQAAELLNHAKRPILLVGQGVTLARAEEELLHLAEKADLPVAATLLGLSAFPTGHRLFKGMLGMHGNYAANLLCNEADVVLAVGMRFDDRVTGDLTRYLTNAKVIHIDIDVAELNKNVPATVGLHSDAKQALTALLPLIKTTQHQAWHQQFAQLHAQELNTVIEPSTNPRQGQITMAEFIHQLSAQTHGQALLVTDVGQHQMIAARYYQFTCTRSHITSGGLGTMGFALPAALGAQLAQPDRLVITIAGDGGFQMNIQELMVVVQEKLPLKMVILNNGYLGMVRQWQELFFEKRYAFTEMLNPDFVTVAQGYGIAGLKVTTREQLTPAIDTLLTTPSAYLLEVCVAKEDNVFPMVPSGASISETRLK